MKSWEFLITTELSATEEEIQQDVCTVTTQRFL